MHLHDILQLPFERLRARAIDQLHLRLGAMVIDVGCGTGTSFPALMHTIGPQGRVVGVERNRSLLSHAQAKIDLARWRNVDLIAADATTPVFAPESVDAVLIVHANNIVLSVLAIDQIIRWLRPEGRFVAAGTQISYGVYRKLLEPTPIPSPHAPATSPNDAESWTHLRDALHSLSVEEHFRGSMYLVSGMKKR